MWEVCLLMSDENLDTKGSILKFRKFSGSPRPLSKYITIISIKYVIYPKSHDCACRPSHDLTPPPR